MWLLVMFVGAVVREAKQPNPNPNASLGYRTSLPFPPEIAVVSGKGSRPDGVIWSLSSKTVIWIELTSPWEENMSKRHYEKKSK